jgi:UDP-N-acetylglucosamine--N-acetylmuramyl-(pentapeptide) pyrophosphoryl-undecaprenol N-acetylglucosamine transferase
MAARLLRIPTLMWEGNVIPGRSVRTTARLATVLAVSFPSTCRALRGSGPCLVTGTPIRDLAGIDRLAARERLGLAPTDRLVVIFGGSQAVRRLNAAVSGALPDLVSGRVVIHVAGPEGFSAAAAARTSLPEPDRDRYRPSAFLGAELLDALAAADLVVGRAGSSTLAEATAFGLPMIVIPYPHAGAHQRANAAAVATAGAATLIDDDDLDATSLLAAIRDLEAPARHAAMAAAARALGRPGAADATADILIALAERRVLPDAARVDRIATSPAGAAAT